jgi:hypothetical protein
VRSRSPTPRSVSATPHKNSMRGSEPVLGSPPAATARRVSATFTLLAPASGALSARGTGGVLETLGAPRASVVACAAAAAGAASAAAAARAAMRRDPDMPRTLEQRARRARLPALRYRRAVLTDAQTERLQACARVLHPPARVVLTGNVATDALAALRAGAMPGVDVLIVPASQIEGVEASIDVLFVGPASPYSAAVELFQRWPGRVVPGGTLFVHGAFTLAPLTAALLRTVGSSRAWRYFGREGALAEYVRADLSHGERVLDAFAQAAQLPWFARRLARRRAGAPGSS